MWDLWRGGSKVALLGGLLPGLQRSRKRSGIGNTISEMLETEERDTYILAAHMAAEMRLYTHVRGGTHEAEERQEGRTNGSYKRCREEHGNSMLGGAAKSGVDIDGGRVDPTVPSEGKVAN